MKHFLRSFGNSIAIFLFALLILASIFLIRTMMVSSDVSAPNNTGQASLQEAYPPVSQDNGTDKLPEAYPPPVSLQVTEAQPKVGQELEPWPTFTPFPTPTRRSEPTPTAIPLPGPAKHSAGNITYFVRDADSSLTAFSLVTNEVGETAANSERLTLDSMRISEPVSAYPSPDGTRIILTDGWGIRYVFYPETGHSRLLFQNIIDPKGQSFNWHPDSRSFLMEAEDGTKDTGLWLVNVETGEYTVLLHQFPTPHIIAGAVSPDGQSVVYALNSRGIYEIWFSNIDGNDARKIYETATDVGLFSWSPDGHYLAMSGGRVLDMQNYELQTMVQNMANGYGYSFSPVWSPDSSRIAYMAFDGPNPLTDKSLLQEGYNVDIFKGVSIHILDIRTGKEQPLLKDGSTGHIDPVWSPTGTQIAFTSMMSGQTEIWQVNEDGTDLRQLTSNQGFVRFPYWSSTLLSSDAENQ